MTNVLEFFTAKFPTAVLDRSEKANLASMPIDSNCGEDCVTAIGAARHFADEIFRAYGEFGTTKINAIGKAAVDVCEVYICG